MRALVGWFDSWVARGPFVNQDVSRYRVIYAVVLLLGLPRFSWVSSYPDSLYDPPPGPFQLLTGFPPEWFLIGLEILVAISAGFLLVGAHVRAASVTATLALIVGSGFAYSLGKIDHNILRSLAPIVLVLAAWGGSTALRAHRSRRDTQPQWPMRLFALIVGLALFTAAAPKVLAGWLSPDTQAVQGFLSREFYLNDRQDLLAPTFVGIDVRLFWEVMDWATVGLEMAVLLAVLNWRAFRMVLAVMTLFHMGVYLMMNISFAGNVLIYGAFVQWGAVRLPVVRVPQIVRTLAPLLAVVVGGGAWFLTRQLGNPGIGPVVLTLGALLSAWYLVVNVVALVRGATRQNAGRSA